MCAMEVSMNRTIVATALLLGTSLAAQAYPVAMYYDLIRPNGHPRSAAIYQSNLDACYRQTGQSRYKADGPAFKKCMLSRGYRFVWQRYVPNPRHSYGGPSDDGEDESYLNQQPPIFDPNTLPQPVAPPPVETPPPPPPPPLPPPPMNDFPGTTWQ